MIHSHTKHRAFTLLEVLIATFVLALGTLGLLVLFAGAADQQRRASQTTQSVFVSRSAEAIVARRLGPIDEDQTLGPGFNTLFPFGNWFPVRADNANNLSIDPDNSGDLYFTLEADSGTILYDRPQNTQATLTLQRANRYAENAGGIIQEIINGVQAAPGFSTRRLEARSIIIEVETSRPDPSGTNARTQVRVDRFVHNPAFDNSDPRDPLSPFQNIYGMEPTTAGDCNTGRLFADTFIGNTNNLAVYQPVNRTLDDCEYNAYIVLDLQNAPVVGGNSARLVAFRFGQGASPNFAGNRNLDRIRVTRYATRNATIVSLDDRVTYVPDDSYNEGVRPAFAYAAVQRRLETGGSQVGIFTYALSGGTTTQRYAPNDRDPNASALQRINFTLGYDDIAERHYAEVSAADAWAVKPGQLLLVDDGPVVSGGVGGNFNLGGADSAVRVLRRTQRGNTFRGELSRVPRSAGFAMLEARGGTVTLSAWVLRDTAISANDGSEWAITPIDLRIFPIAN